MDTTISSSVINAIIGWTPARHATSGIDNHDVQPAIVILSSAHLLHQGHTASAADAV